MNNRKSLRENKMGTMPLGRLLLNMAIPMVMAMLVQALYNVVDSLYVSRISENAVTALSLAFPIQNIQIGFATGIGVGVNAILSKSLGEGEQERANRSAGNGFLLASIVTVAFIIFGIFGVRPFFSIQSNNIAVVEGGIDYLTICTVFSMGIFVEILGERLLQASGRTAYTLITQGCGAITNILLDPVFIFGVEPLGIPAMGLAGAAIATVTGQWLAAILAVILNFKCNPDIRLGWKYWKPKKETLVPILTVGIPSVIMVAIGSVMNFSVNQILQGLNETATGVFGIYFKLQSFFFMPLFAINNATISIMAYNFGTRNPRRITGTLKRATVTAMGIMALGLLVFQLIPDVLLNMFHPSEEFLHIGRGALKTISLSFPLAAVGISVSAVFQALGNGIYSTITSVCRQMLVLLPAAYLLSLSGNVVMVWWAFPIAEIVSALVTLFLFLRIYRKKIKPLPV
ncbi:MAG: MATE family efflux transporter [Ruminococcaceae bacterium]|nr:MATE family efflux transporter [Oscillospiraceae bacterium]